MRKNSVGRVSGQYSSRLKSESSKTNSVKNSEASSKRTSSDALKKLSISSRNPCTPLRNHFLSVPGTVSRVSTDSTVSIGKRRKKDQRPVTSAAYKTLCIDRIIQFLLKDGIEISRRTLSLPTSKDFQAVFKAVFVHLDPGFQFSKNYETELPLLMKTLGYPVAVMKSSLVTVSSPHTWPHILAMLAWLVDAIEPLEDNIVQTLFNNDFEENSKCESFVALGKLITAVSSEEKEHILQEFDCVLDEKWDTSPQNIEQLQSIDLELENMLDNLGSGYNILEEKQLQLQRFLTDIEKLSVYCNDLVIHIQQAESEYYSVENELKIQKQKDAIDSEKIDKLKLQIQECKFNEAPNFRNEVFEEANLRSLLLQSNKDIHNEICNIEIVYGKAHEELNNNFCLYNNKCRSAGIDGYYIINTALDSDYSNLKDMHLELIQLKKTVKQEVFAIESHIIKKSGDYRKFEQSVAECNDRNTKLKCSLKRISSELDEVNKENCMAQLIKRNEHISHDMEELMEKTKALKLFSAQSNIAFELACKELSEINENNEKRKSDAMLTYKKKHDLLVEEGHKEDEVVLNILNELLNEEMESCQKFKALIPMVVSNKKELENILKELSSE